MQTRSPAETNGAAQAPVPPLTRRRFLQTTGAAAAGAGLGVMGLAGKARAVSANEKIVVAHIGVGGMGNGHLGWFAGFPDVEIAALCDVDQTRLEGTLARLTELRPDTKTDCYGDFRRVLERGDIDAVTCATPDHWHALISILAFQAGKDVYSEKPLCHTFAESVAMVNARRRYDRVFQLGTQIHEGENYHRTVELVRSGALGKIHTVRLWKTGGAPDMGFPPDEAPPPGLDWEMWLGPAPWSPYTPARCPFNFRYFWDYSGGVYADFWCHIADIAFWALEDLGAPRTIEARGEPPASGIADTPAWVDVDYDCGDRQVCWTTDIPDVPGAAGRGIGCVFEGERGSLVVDYGSRALFLDGQELTDLPDVPVSLPRSPGHQRNFVDCVRSRELTESNLDYAYRMTLPLHLGCISFRLGRKLTWDDTQQQFADDAAANRMLSQPYRAPWYLPT